MFLTTRRFLPLFITQFLGAFNDNVFKNALVMLITYKISGSDNPQILVTLAAGLFILPFLLFSATAGQLADKYDRSKMAQWVKLVEILLMSISAIGFYISSAYFLLFVLFCLGAQATFFGPIKYALLPQHLHENELIAGNAWIEAGTFLAILLGTITGGLLIIQAEGVSLIVTATTLCAVGGYMASHAIPAAPAPMPQLAISWRIARETWQIIKQDMQNRRVFLSIVGISWFWLIGATFLSQFPTYVKDVLHAEGSVVTLFLAVFSIGIGVGSFLCSALLKGRISSHLVPWAATAITIFTIDLFFASQHIIDTPGGVLRLQQFLQSFAGQRILLDLFAIAISGGLYIVPLYTIMQHDSDPVHRARTIASNNIMNALFMVMAAIGTMAMLSMHFTVPHVFLTVAIFNSFVIVYSVRLRRENYSA